MAEQRLAGTVIGAVVAAVFLLSVDNMHALLVIIVVLCGLAVVIRYVNYAWYCAAVAAFVLIGMNVSHPTDFADEGRRILFTFIGVAIAVAVLFVANMLQQRTTAPAGHAPNAASPRSQS